ncbi:MAG: helix-turn-helix domain-containing protein [Nitrospira sp.]|nr:helix-turn-helix domain-containing protein [Nitrospira sp.]
MKRIQAYKFELMPDGQQQNHMRRFAGSCRFVFNRALALQKERYEQREKNLGYAGLCKLLTEWRNSQETAWLADAPVHPLQQSLKNLERAYANFFPSVQPVHVSRRRARVRGSAIRILNRSSWSKVIAAYFSQNLAGYDIATAAKYSARSRTSP